MATCTGQDSETRFVLRGAPFRLFNLYCRRCNFVRGIGTWRRFFRRVRRLDDLPLGVSRFAFPSRLQASRQLEAGEYMRFGVENNGVQR